MGNSSSSPRRSQRQPSIPTPGPVPPAPVVAPPPPGYPGVHPQYRPPPTAGYLPYPPQYPGAPPPAQWGGYAPNGQYYGVQGNGQWMMNGAAGPMFRMPVPQVPGPLPQMVEPQRTATIRNDVNLKRLTLRLERDPENPGQHLVAFSFDATVAGSVCIFFLAKEGDSCSFTSVKPDLYTPTKVPFEKGLGQKFQQAPGTGVDLSRFTEEELTKEASGEVFPLVVRTETVPKNPPPDAPSRENDPPGSRLPKWVQSQTTYAYLEKHHDGEYTVKVSKQKIWVDGMRYELQEIYGIEHSGGGTATDASDPSSDIGKECVICMSEPRDTTVLPCRHMCMCSECAKVLRFQDNRCPICRQVVERLLEIRVPGPSRAPPPGAGTAGQEGVAEGSQLAEAGPANWAEGGGRENTESLAAGGDKS